MSTYYVATTGSNAAAGTQGAPWLTIGYAAATIAGGDDVHVAGGSYNERVTIAQAKSGTAGKHTRFVADGAACVTQGFDVKAAYVDLDGFEVTPGSASIPDADYVGQVFVHNAHVSLISLYVHDLARSSAICIGCKTESGNVRADFTNVSDCVIEDVPWTGISVDNGGRAGTHPADVTITGTAIRRCGGWQSIKAYGDRWLIEDCEVQGPSQGDPVKPGQDYDGISVNYSVGTIIRRTRIHDIWGHVGFTSGGNHADCIQFWYDVSDLLIDGCTLGSWKPGGYDKTPGAVNAIMAGTVNAASTPCSVTVQNCLLLCGIATGIQANAHLGSGAAASPATLAMHIYNNTFFGNYAVYNGAGVTADAYNNVYYAHRAGYVADTSDYNAFMWAQWSDQSTGLRASTVTAAEAASPHCLGKTYAARLAAADLFVDPDVTASGDYGLAADFSPRPGGVLIGAADPAHAPDHDILGHPRSATAPTIGAYEAPVDHEPGPGPAASITVNLMLPEGAIIGAASQVGGMLVLPITIASDSAASLNLALTGQIGVPL